MKRELENLYTNLITQQRNIVKHWPYLSREYSECQSKVNRVIVFWIFTFVETYEYWKFDGIFSFNYLSVSECCMCRYWYGFPWSLENFLGLQPWLLSQSRQNSEDHSVSVDILKDMGAWISNAVMQADLPTTDPKILQKSTCPCRKRSEKLIFFRGDVCFRIDSREWYLIEIYFKTANLAKISGRQFYPF